MSNFTELPLEAIEEPIVARPLVSYKVDEVEDVLEKLREAVDNENYIPQKATEKNPALSDEYIFETQDQNQILKNLKVKNLVGKVKDKGEGAKKRETKGFPPEFLYVFKYACILKRRDADITGNEQENVLVYIKINARKIPRDVMIIVSFHKNHAKK